MQIEYSDRRPTGVAVPSPAEHIEAERRGVAVSSSFIQTLRAEARAGQVSPSKGAIATTDADNARTITVLRRQVERLLRDNAALKLKLITSK